MTMARRKLSGKADEASNIQRTIKSLYARHSQGQLNASAVYRTLAEAIETNVLPPGWALREEQLTQLFPVSRTPVREALMRLESERLAERHPRQGLVVAVITRREILDIYVVREALDALAARLSAQYASPIDIMELKHLKDEMARALDEDDVVRLTQRNVAFHEVLARSSRNQILERFVGQIHSYVRRFQSTTLSHPGRAEEAIAEHGALISALERGDAEEAERIARQHMSKALSIRMEMYASLFEASERET